MNGKRCALALAMLAAALLLMGCGAAEPTPVGPVDLYTRRTLVRYDRTQAGQGQGSTLQAESLDLNDAVTVDDSGQARLAFEDFLVVDIFRDSDLRIEGLSAPDAPPAYRLRLEGGTISGTTDAQSLAEERVEPEVRIDTKWAVIRKKGTVFIIHFDKASEQTWVVVKRGAMSVTAAGKEVLVEGGQQTWVEPGKAPIDPIPACRNLVGSRFPLIDALTNDVLPDLEWLCNDSTLTGSTPTIAAPSPTPTPTLRPLPQPTATPRPPTPTPLPTGTPYASIFANPGVIQACTCTNLGWDAGNVTSVTLDGATAYTGDNLGGGRVVAGAWFRFRYAWAGAGGAGTGGPGGYNLRRDALPLGAMHDDKQWEWPNVVQCVGGPFLPLVTAGPAHWRWSDVLLLIPIGIAFILLGEYRRPKPPK